MIDCIQLSHKNQSEHNPIKFHAGFTDAFLNKNLRPGISEAAWKHYIQKQATPQMLCEHLLSGRAIQPGHFKNDRRRYIDFQDSQIVVLDYDDHVSVADLLAIPFVREYALLVYPTPSSSLTKFKSRAIFILSEPVDNHLRWTALVKGIAAHIGLPVDKNSFKASQPYFGSTNRIEEPQINLDAILPIELAGALTVDLATDEMLGEFARREKVQNRQERRTERMSRTYEEAYAKAVLNRIVDTYMAVPGGAGQRHGSFVAMTTNLCGKFKGEWPGFESWESIVQETGERTDRTRSEIQDAIQWASQNAKPDPFNPPPPQSKADRQKEAQKPLAQRVNTVTLSSFTADLTVNQRYISDLSPAVLDGYGIGIVKSAMDTGKTEWIKRIIAHKEQELGREPTCLYLCHSAPLTEHVAKRLEFFSYTALQASSGISIRSAPQLAITFDSAWRVAGVVYDLVIMDEGSKGLAQFGSATMQGGAKVRSYRTVRELVASCQVVYVLDAQNADYVTDWLKGVKKGARVLSIENTYRPQSMAITLLNSKAVAYAEIDARLSEDQGTVYIAVDTIAESYLIQAHLQAKYPEKLGMLINGDNSQSKEVQGFLSVIDTELPELHYVICSPSVKSGISIDPPIHAEIGLFTNPDFSADDRLQMMGRARNVQHRAAFVQPSQGQRETDLQAIFTQGTGNAITTGQVCNFAARGIQARNPDLDSVHKLLSLIQVERNRQLNDPLSFFIALARQEGYRVEFNERFENQEIAKTYSDLRKKLKAEHDQRIPNAVLISGDEMDVHRRAGTVTPEIRAGFERWQIQTPFGFTVVTPQIQADLGRSSQRTRVSRLANMLDSTGDLKDTDANEALEERIYDNRHHHTLQVQFIDARIREMFGCSLIELPNVLKDMPASDLEQRAGALGLYMPQLKSLFNYRPTHDAHDTAIARLRWLLRQFAIEMDKRQVMVNRERFMVYSIDLPTWERFMDYANAMLKERQKARAERLLQTAKDSSMAIHSNPPRRPQNQAMGERFNPIYLQELTAMRC